MQLGKIRIWVIALIGIFAIGTAVLFVFWPGERAGQTQAVFSYLQFTAALALVFLTLIYVDTTRTLAAAQDRKPEIRARIGSCNLRDRGMLVQVTLAIANPSTRATSVRIIGGSVNGIQARIVTLAWSNVTMRESITVAAGDLKELTADVEFDSVPIEVGGMNSAELIFEDIFHGLLPKVSTESARSKATSEHQSPFAAHA